MKIMRKTIIRISAFTLVLTFLAIALVSCGGLSGKYESSIIGTGAAFTFKGSKVTLDIMVLGSISSIEGKYKIDGDKITLAYEGDDKEADRYEGTFTFERGDDYIKIGGVKYTKVD